MQLIAFATALIAALPNVLAQGPGNRPGLCYPSSCGYAIVNGGSLTQGNIAKMRCGRTDTCNGEEWNSIYFMGINGKWGGGSQFCSTGCYIVQEGICQIARCH